MKSELRWKEKEGHSCQAGEAIKKAPETRKLPILVKQRMRMSGGGRFHQRFWATSDDASPQTPVLLMDIKDRMCVPFCDRLSGNIGLQPPLSLHDVPIFHPESRRQEELAVGILQSSVDATSHSHSIRQSVRGGSVFRRLGGILDELPVDQREKKRTFLFLASFPLHSSERRFPSFQRFI